MALDCVFCKIVAKEIPAEIVLETDQVIAFPDQNPQAPTHLLIIPKQHIPGLAHVSETNMTLLAGLMLAAKELAVRYQLDNGFRLVANSGKSAGQTVDHLHFHLMGGRNFSWPPG